MIFKHQGALCLLLGLSLLRLEGFWPGSPISMAPITVIVCYLLLFWKVNVTIGIKEFLDRNKLTLSLIIGLHLVLFISLIINSNLFELNTSQVINGVDLIVAQSLVFVTLFLFSLPQSDSGISLSKHFNSDKPIIIFICLIGILSLLRNFFPFHFFETVEYFLVFDYFQEQLNNGEEINSAIQKWKENSSGLFAATTDLGSISAIVVLFFFYYGYSQKFKSSNFCLAIFLIVIYFGLGAFSHSLSFFLILSICFGLMFIRHFNDSISTVLKNLAVMCAGIHTLIYFLPTGTAYKLKDFFPYIYSYRYAKCVTFSDFIPNFSISSLGERGQIWLASWQAIQDNMLIGVSNIVFRLHFLESSHYNSHNLFLQILVDSGIVGGGFIALLFFKVMYSHIKTNLNGTLFTLIFISVVLSLMVDFYLDHSIPWILLTSYLLCHSLKMHVKWGQNSNCGAVHPIISLSFSLLVLCLFVWTIFDYLRKSECLI